MATKNLAIREDVYRRLAGVKRGDESFSDVIERLLTKRSSLLHFWGSLADSSDLGEIEREAKETRKKAVTRV